MKVGFIGVGNMGSALLKGMIHAGVVKPGSVSAYDQDATKLGALVRTQKIKKASSNEDVVRASDIVFLCVKPGQIAEILPGISLTSASTSPKSKKVIVSIAAGIPLSRLQSGLPKGTPVVRVMPNTPALLGAGAIALSPGRWARRKDLAGVRRLLSTVGETVVLNERHMNAVTAVSGSGPAYVFYLAEAMAEACDSLGLPPSVSQMLCRQTVFGAGLMLKKLPAEPKILREQVTSPGGTTEAAIQFLESTKVRRRLRQAIQAAAAKAGELARDN